LAIVTGLSSLDSNIAFSSSEMFKSFFDFLSTLPQLQRISNRVIIKKNIAHNELFI
jgi:hypothetical protein